MQGRDSDIAVDTVLLLFGRIFLKVVIEYRGVRIDVKCQLSPIEIRIFCNLRIIISHCRITESGQRSHFVPGLDIAVSKMIIGHLADGIRTFGHIAEAPDSSFIIIHSI